jgi:hypothetical protein
MRRVKFHPHPELASPPRQQRKNGLESRLVFRRVVVNRKEDCRLAVLPERSRKPRMPMKEKAIRNQAERRVRPIATGEQDKLGQLRMDRRLTAEQGKNLGMHPLIPELHPPIRFRERENAAVPVIRVMRTTFARQIAGVDEMDFQIPNCLHGAPFAYASER